MKVSINKDEWYPVYFIYESKGDDEKTDIPDDKVKEIKEVFKEFGKVQRYLARLDRES